MFSVVIPLYNKAQTVVAQFRVSYHRISRTLRSSSSMTAPPTTAPRIEQHFNDPRIRLIRQKNVSEGGVRNSGIDAARYKRIVPVDADDSWLPGYLSQVNNALQQFSRGWDVLLRVVGLYPDGSGFVRQSKNHSTNPRKVDFFEAPFCVALS